MLREALPGRRGAQRSSFGILTVCWQALGNRLSMYGVCFGLLFVGEFSEIGFLCMVYALVFLL